VLRLPLRSHALFVYLFNGYSLNLLLSTYPTTISLPFFLPEDLFSVRWTLLNLYIYYGSHTFKAAC